MLDEPQELLQRQPFLPDNAAPLSPRQRPADDDSRRSSFSGQFRAGGYFRPPAPPHIANPPRRFGSAGLAGPSSPNSLRPQPAPQPSQQPSQHPLATYQSPPSHLSRRHTSADIRVHGWQANSPFSGIGQYGPHWPPSPSRQHSSDNTRESLANYDIQQHRPPGSTFASQTTPPLTEAMGHSEGWNFGTKFPPSREAGHTAPPTRRSSLASSSVHALLNPPENSIDREGISDGEPDDRKRKRMA